jgi:hypothetical protein
METAKNETPVTGVPKQVFEKFLNELEGKKVTADVVARLKKTLIDHGDISETAIKTALFDDDNTAV